MSTDVIVNDARTSGELDDTLFTRSELREMLYFINYCYRIWNWPEYTKAPGRKLEKLIRIYIPASYSSQKAVLEWIEQNWSHYWEKMLIR